MPKPKGWTRDGYQHGLARKGIRSKGQMKPPMRKVELRKDIIKEQYEDLIEKNKIFFEKYHDDGGLLIEDYGVGMVEMTEWTNLHGLGFEKEIEAGTPFLKTSTAVEIEELLDPEAKHRGSYAGDTKVSQVTPEAITNASISYLAYWGGEESFVEKAGD